jgi:DNA-binding NtrC family response regulator
MNEMTPGHRIAVIDDEPIVADTLVQILRMHGYQARAYYSGEAALADGIEFRPEVVLSDVRMPRMDGIETARHMRDYLPGCRMILFTASPLGGGSYEMIHQLGFEFLERPLHPREVLALLANPQWPCPPTVSAAQHGGQTACMRAS